jgi:transposase
MRTLCATLALASMARIAAANTPPTVQVLSATMRPGTTWMDVTYRITDPDDATVKVRALAFRNGVRSFANVIRPVTWAGGTQTNIGDAIATGVTNKLTWDVRADWNIDLAQVKFEVLCRDSRGLLPFNWITIPATSNTTALTISTSVPSDTQVLDALFWMYADGDPWLTVSGGNLKGTAATGIFSNEVLVSGTSLQPDAPTVFLYKKMNIARATFAEKDFAISARSAIADRYVLMYAVNRPWDESALGSDPTALTSTPINNRWVRHTYAGGAITMSDRFNGLMWCYNATAFVDYFETAQSACARSGYANHHDWRVPSMTLLMLMYFQKGFFINTSGVFWSSEAGGPGARTLLHGSCRPPLMACGVGRLERGLRWEPG